MSVPILDKTILKQIFKKKDGIFDNTLIVNDEKFLKLKSDFGAEEGKLASVKNSSGKEINWIQSENMTQ
jgi:hypothetical protein